MSGEWNKESYEFQFMGEFYKLCKEFYIPDDGMEYWDKLIKASCALCNKYNNTDFVTRLTIGFIEYASAEWQKKNYGTPKKPYKDLADALDKFIKEKKQTAKSG